MASINNAAWMLIPLSIGLLAIAALQPNYLRRLAYPEAQPLAAYFSEDYASARLRFIAAASARGAVVTSHPVDSAAGLYVDAAVLEGDPRALVVHISGTHGVEGYAGSAIQLAVLDLLPSLNSSATASRPTTVLVHALNPFGFKMNRRVNEDNVDLNRNFLNATELAALAARAPNFAGYDDVAFVLNRNGSLLSPSVLVNECLSLALAAYCALVYGVSKVKVALVSGNYRYPRGLGFGGVKASRSADILRRILAERTGAGVESVVLIDVHTGLGPSGVDSLAVDMPRGLDLGGLDIDAAFPSDNKGGLKDSLAAPGRTSAFSGYGLTRGTIGGDLCPALASARPWVRSLVCVTQEFGTVSNIAVGRALVLENIAYFFEPARWAAHYSAQLKKVFCLDSPEWRAAVVTRGLAVLEQAVSAALLSTQVEDPDRGASE